MIAAPTLREYQIGGDKRANLVVHRVTQAVVADPRYAEWAEQFPEKTEVCAIFIDVEYGDLTQPLMASRTAYRDRGRRGIGCHNVYVQLLEPPSFEYAR